MKKIYTIGRDENCDIVIPDNTDIISRMHATIRVEPNGKMFINDQSRNGTYINGMKMSSNVEIPVSRKDVISFAHIYNLDWSLVPKSKNVLRQVLLGLGILVVIAGIAYAVSVYVLPRQKHEEHTEQPEYNVHDIVEEESGETEEAIAEPEPVVERKKAPVQEKQDTVKVEVPQEKVYDPIY